MKVVNKKNTTITTPLRHYPYEDRRSSSSSSTVPENLIDEVKMENQGSGFNQPPPYFHTPSPPSSQPPPLYMIPAIPYSDDQYFPNIDRPLTTPESYDYNLSNRSTISRSDFGTEEDDDYTSGPLILKGAKKSKSRASNNNRRGSGGMKPARKYETKPQCEKNTAAYQIARQRNNEAVRRSRAKTAKAQAEKEAEMQEMKEKIDDLTDSNEDLKNLLLRIKGDLCKNMPEPGFFNTYPSFAELLAFNPPN